MLAFQKRGARLKIARAPILKRIERHKQDLGELAEKVQIRTKESLEPLKVWSRYTTRLPASRVVLASLQILSRNSTTKRTSGPKSWV